MLRSRLVLGGLGICVLGIGIGFFWWQQKGFSSGISKNLLPFVSENTAAELPRFFFGVNPPQSSRSLLDDISRSTPGSTEKEFAIATMIDNSVAGRPLQTGVADASVVFEALAEGGVTRFMALFSSRDTVEKIGPIRSTRSYFFDWFKPFHGIFVHAGGSDAVLAELQTQNDVFNVDDVYLDDPTFWRDPHISAPHNLFTGSEVLKQKLLATANTAGFAALLQPIFPFSTDKISGTAVRTLTLDFSTTEYSSSWQWNTQNKVFERQQQGSKLPIAVTNLAVMEVPMWLIEGDEKGRLDSQNIGSGRLMLLQNGMYREGTWRKITKNAPLEFLGADGKKLSFLSGKTWIAVVNDWNKVSWQ